MELSCAITTPEKLVHEGPARLVVVPTTEGELGILPRHAPLMAILGTGELRLHVPGGDQISLFVSGGFVQVIDNVVNVLATEADLASDIDGKEARAELAKLEGETPTGLSAAERETRNETLRAAKLRAKLAGGASE